jgi:hypothetical protein
VSDPLGRRVRLVSDRPLTARLSADDVVKASAQLDRALKLPGDVGDVFGSLEFTRDGESLGSVNLIAARSLEPPTINMIRDYWRDGGLRGLAPVR